MVMIFTLISAVQEKLLEYEKIACESLDKEKREMEEQNKKREEVGNIWCHDYLKYIAF